MRTFEITASSHSAEARPGERVEVRFTVTSRSDHALIGRAEARVGEGTDRRWIAIDPERPRFSAGGTERLTVALAVPESASEGRHEVKLVVANEENPDDDWTESAPITITIRAAEEKKSIPWWVPVAAISVVIVAVGGWVTFRLMQRPGFADACEPGECAAGLVCTSTAQVVCASSTGFVCLGDLGWPCAAQDDCGRHLSCAKEDGERPNPEQQPACRDPAGVAQSDGESEFECREPQPQWPCRRNTECAENQSCILRDRQRICALNDGERNCRQGADCVSGGCFRGHCVARIE